MDRRDGGVGPRRGSKCVPIGAVAGDYDNDGRADLFVLRYGGSSLYHNDGNGHFTDVDGAPACRRIRFCRARRRLSTSITTATSIS